MDDEQLQIAYMEEKADFEEYGHMQNEEGQNDDDVEVAEKEMQKQQREEVADGYINLFNILK